MAEGERGAGPGASCWPSPGWWPPSRCGRATRRSGGPPTTPSAPSPCPPRPTTWPCRTCGRSASGSSTRRSGAAAAPSAQVVLEGMWFTFRVSMVGFVVGVGVGLAAGRADAAVPHRRAQPAPVGDRVPDRAARGAGPPGGRLGRPARGVRAGVAAVDVGGAHLRLPGLLPRRRRRAPRAAVTVAGVGGVDGVLRRRPLADAAGHALPRRRAVPRAGAEAGRGRRGGGSDRGRDLHRARAAGSAA